MKCVMCVFGGGTWAVPVNTGVLMSLLPSCAIALCYLVLMSMLCTVCCVLCATVPSSQFHSTSYCAITLCYLDSDPKMCCFGKDFPLHSYFC